MKKEIKLYLERADGFIDDAINDLKKGRYDLAMVHVELAIQLLIKAKLLDLKGFFEKTHHLRKLLKELAEIYKPEEIYNFLEKYRETLKIIEFSYIAGRYLMEEFEKEDVENALKVYEELRKLLWE